MKKVCYLAPASNIHTVRWVNALVKNQFDVILITMHDPDMDKIDPNVKIEVLPFKKGYGYYLNIWSLKYLLRKYSPDFLHVHYASGYGTLARLAKVKTMILSVWGSDVYLFPKKREINERIIRKNLSYADIITSTSYDMERETKKYLESEKEIYITPFGIDTQLFKADNDKRSTDNGQFFIGIAKKLEKVYGIDYLIQAVSELQEKLKAKGYNDISNNLKLIIIGEGSQREELNRLVKNLELEEQVEFIGNVPNVEIPNYLNKLDVFCIPSLSESFGVAALEASACKIPVIASNVGGLPEVVLHGETGYLVEPKNSKELSERLFELAVSPHLRKKFGEKGRELVNSQYSWEESVKIMLEVYNCLEK
ncbi:glycosyltransferase [Bacillus cereus]|uniref:glycosyltransferase n=1 Tax=Bacillus cereus TaxID=1396 RepID=UPI000BF650BB|nr:glycosyltransferase [Bacillus cereus]PER82242.1 glycosyl transferase [Bacillus cereus]